MNTTKICAIAASLFFLCFSSAQAQNVLRWTFKGTSYQTNASGNVISTPVTDQDILSEKAYLGGSSTNGWAMAFHLKGSSFGDTVDIVNTSNGQTITTVLGYYFGDDSVQLLGRGAITNATQTEVRRLDYIYTDQNSHSMGAAFVTRRTLTDGSGNPRTTLEGPIMWLELPRGTNNTRVYSGTFTTGAPLF
jgi:hypothetical protein